jgi:hypothetical protein
MSQLMSKLYQVANNMTLMSLRSWVQQSSILFCTIDYDTRNTYFITWWSTNCRDTRDKKRYLKETSVPCYYCIANKSESSYPKSQRNRSGLLEYCISIHVLFFICGILLQNVWCLQSLKLPPHCKKKNSTLYLWNRPETRTACCHLSAR